MQVFPKARMERLELRMIRFAAEVGVKDPLAVWFVSVAFARLQGDKHRVNLRKLSWIVYFQ